MAKFGKFIGKELTICVKENWAAKVLDDDTIVLIELRPEGLMRHVVEDGYMGGEGASEEDACPIAHIARKSHLELVSVWPASRDTEWAGNFSNYRATTLGLLPYVQVYRDGYIAITDTAICDGVAPSEPEHAAVKKYVDSFVEPVRKELEELMKNL